LRRVSVVGRSGTGSLGREACAAKVNVFGNGSGAEAFQFCGRVDNVGIRVDIALWDDSRQRRPNNIVLGKLMLERGWTHWSTMQLAGDFGCATRKAG